jgi:protoporphyrinogen oxidase
VIAVNPDRTVPQKIRTRFALLGAGPTGLGAAWRLSQLPNGGRSEPNVDANSDADEHSGNLLFLIIDESQFPGGRAASVTTPEGFTFDYGGHVLFPHAEYGEFIALLTSVIPEWHSSTPVRGVWIENRFILTPVQRNIHRLPLPDMAACLWGLCRRKPNNGNGVELNLREYLESQFGEALTRLVMAPLNQKMWAHPPETLGSHWSSHRSGSSEKNIPGVRVGRVLCNWLLNRDEPGWTADTTVRYPRIGGCGAIWSRVFASIPENFRCLNSRVRAIDAARKLLCLADGSCVQYERLITSIPLDMLLRLLCDQPALRARACEFRAAKVQLFGFGLQGATPRVLEGVHAISVPAPEIPFWRINIPSNFSPGNVPDPSHTWSILCESSIAPGSDIHYEHNQVEAALRQMGLIPDETKIISVFSAAIKHGYPVPFAGRDQLLNEVQAELEHLDIFSRGRFGGWRYEVSNQDHSFMQGVEVIDRLLEGNPEHTYRKTW